MRGAGVNRSSRERAREERLAFVSALSAVLPTELFTRTEPLVRRKGKLFGPS